LGQREHISLTATTWAWCSREPTYIAYLSPTRDVCERRKLNVPERPVYNLQYGQVVEECMSFLGGKASGSRLKSQTRGEANSTILLERCNSKRQLRASLSSRDHHHLASVNFHQDIVEINFNIATFSSISYFMVLA
jgi:hypothetical protein